MKYIRTQTSVGVSGHRQHEVYQDSTKQKVFQDTDSMRYIRTQTSVGVSGHRQHEVYQDSNKQKAFRVANSRPCVMT